MKKVLLIAWVWRTKEAPYKSMLRYSGRGWLACWGSSRCEVVFSMLLLYLLAKKLGIGDLAIEIGKFQDCS